jgi:transcriptional regulator with XRE-family HTH domain
MLPRMTDQRVGAGIRAVRIRRGLRQVDLAKRAGVSQGLVSRIERGHFEGVTIDALRRVAAALDIRLDVVARWRAGDLDRLLNRAHSALHEEVAQRFSSLPGWIADPDVSFAFFAERGVIDILAWHPGRRALLVIELKTEIVDVNELVGTLDRKERLAKRVARDRGWFGTNDAAVVVSTWLIVADTRTNRRRVAAHATMLRSRFPVDGRSMDGWLANPDRRIAALSYWAMPATRTASGVGRGTRRVRVASRELPA